MHTIAGTYYTRKYVDKGKISSQDLMTAYNAAARLVAEHGDAYLPLFERLDAEVQALDKKEEIRRRALELANVPTPSGPESSGS